MSYFIWFVILPVVSIDIKMENKNIYLFIHWVLQWFQALNSFHSVTTTTRTNCCFFFVSLFLITWKQETKGKYNNHIAVNAIQERIEILCTYFIIITTRTIVKQSKNLKWNIKLHPKEFFRTTIENTSQLNILLYFPFFHSFNNSEFQSYFLARIFNLLSSFL